MSYQERRNALLSSIGTSYALQQAIAAFDRRDPVDAANDAVALVELMKLRAFETMREAYGKGR